MSSEWTYITFKIHIDNHTLLTRFHNKSIREYHPQLEGNVNNTESLPQYPVLYAA